MLSEEFPAVAMLVQKISLPLNYKTKDSCNQPRYDRVRYFKCSLIIGFHNNWIIINFFDVITDEVEYEYINITII